VSVRLINVRTLPNRTLHGAGVLQPGAEASTGPSTHPLGYWNGNRSFFNHLRTVHFS